MSTNVRMGKNETSGSQYCLSVTFGLLIRISHVFLATHWPQYFSCRHTLITMDALSQTHKVKAASSCFGGLQWQASHRLRGDHR